MFARLLAPVPAAAVDGGVVVITRSAHDACRSASCAFLSWLQPYSLLLRNVPGTLSRLACEGSGSHSD